MERRNLVNGGLVAGLTALVTAHAPEASARPAAAADEDTHRVVGAINQLENSVNSGFRSLRAGPFGGVDAVRAQQREWLKSFHKYPDFIDIGISVWENFFDWHVQHQQPLSMARQPDGRYVMAFNFTTLIMRPDQAADYVSLPYELERARQP